MNLEYQFNNRIEKQDPKNNQNKKKIRNKYPKIDTPKPDLSQVKDDCIIDKLGKWNRDRYMQRDSYMNFGEDSEVNSNEIPPLYKLENVDHQLESLHNKCYLLEKQNAKQKKTIEKLQLELQKIRDLNK